MVKGIWYYEIQILMFVIMWQHDVSHKSQSKGGLRLGRLYIWRDTAWLTHGFGYILYKNWRRATKPVRNAVRFFKSLRSFIRLSRAGFHISHSGNDLIGSEMYRFWWKDRIIKDMSDIDCVDGKYYTMFQGHSTKLDK
jgi:hypothetical protein